MDIGRTEGGHRPDSNRLINRLAFENPMEPGFADFPRSPSFRRFVTIGSALGAMGMCGSLAMLTCGDQGFEFHWRSFVPFVAAAGAAVSWAFWRVVFRLIDQAVETAAAWRRLWIAVAIIMAFAFAAFLYPIRCVSAEVRGDVLIGLFAAVAVLSFAGWALRSLVRAFERASEDDPGAKPGGPP